MEQQANKLIDYIKSLGYNDNLEKYRDHINVWKSWYSGYVQAFHDYTVFNGVTNTKKTRAQLRMAKKGCEKWADLLWNDECSIGINEGEDKKSSAKQTALDEAMERNNFTTQLNRCVEKAFAYGTGAVIIYEENNNARVNFVTADFIYPLAYSNGSISSCAFVSDYNSPGVELSSGQSLKYLMVHRKEKTQYKIDNHFFVVDKDQAIVSEVKLKGVKVSYKTDTCRFDIISPNVANNLPEDTNVNNIPFGVSIFANSLDVLENIDLAYDGINDSMRIGKPRIAVDGKTVKPNMVDGKMEPIFDSNDTTFYVLGDSISEENDRLIQDISVPYRAGDYEQSLQAQLTIFSQDIGLGENTFKWERSSVSTATQVLSQDSTMTRSMRKHQDGIKKPIITICQAILDIELGSTSDDIDVKFDDSVTVNKEAEEQKAWNWVQAGKMAFWRYLVKYEGYSETDAQTVEAEAVEAASKQIKDGLYEDE